MRSMEAVSEFFERMREAAEGVPEIDIAYLFGSRAKGRARPDSDVDVAIHFAHGVGAEQRERARERFLDALAERLGALADRVDLVDLDAASSTLAFHVIRDGRRVFVRDPAARVRLEVRIARRYDDDAPRRELFVRAARRVAAAMEHRHGRS
jgi:uncharacterized protein